MNLFTLPLMFIFSPEVLEILGKCRWNMGNYHHRNWIGKSPPKWPTLTKIWPPPGWAQSPPVGPEEQQEGAGRPPLASCQVGRQVVIKWVVRWSGLWLVWNVSVLRQKPKRRKSWEIHNPRPRDLLRRTQEIQGKPREDVFPNTSRVLVESGCRTASPH